MKPDLVIYHGPECYDGFTAAWLVHQHFPDAEYLPANYGRTNAPDVTGRRVLVVDFSWPRETMERMAVQSEEILVLDHHKTAEEALRGLPFAVFDMNRSGCQLAWDWLVAQREGRTDNGAPPFKPGERPWLVEHVADRDLWRMALPQTPAIHSYYSSVPMTFEAWEALSRMGRDYVVKFGKAIRQALDRYCEKVGREREVYSTLWGDVQVVNAPYLNASELADHLLTTGETKWTVAWFRRSDGKYQYSLRSSGNFDVSVIAKSFSGGGHKNAAGFETLLTPDRLWERRTDA
jgi:nanoRNase/pAp phosphatase (c-di-AMP/oligoRNAs hydrolase)